MAVAVGGVLPTGLMGEAQDHDQLVCSVVVAAAACLMVVT